MGLLDNKVSSEDVNRVSSMHNTPEFEPGFGGGGDDIFSGDGDGGSFSMDDLFSGSDSDGGSSAFGSSGDAFGSSKDPFGGSSSPFGGSPFGGSSSPFGGSSSPFGGSPFGGSPFGGEQQKPVEVKPDAMDKAVEAGAEVAKSFGALMMEIFNSIKNRNADDFGFLSRNIIVFGAVSIPAGLIAGIVGLTSGIEFISFGGMATQLIFAGGIGITSGMIGIGTSALVLSKIGDEEDEDIADLDDIPLGEDNVTCDLEENSGNEFDDLFGDLDDMFVDLDDLDSDEDSFGGAGDINVSLDDVEVEEIDFSKEIEGIEENRIIDRKTLFNTFKHLFPKNAPNFSNCKDIDSDSDDFRTLETICLKALANLANCQVDETGSYLESAKESYFSYELRLKRINKVRKTLDLGKEIEFYVRESSDDDGVNSTVTIEGDFYKIIVTKGVNAVVTFGDIFTQSYCSDYFLDEKHKLPIVVGVDELGKVILEDAKIFDTMLIAGQPRTGKSWYVLSILASLMFFNSPEDVQFIIIDPKESNLFKTLALMPHVCGLHNDENILRIFDDIINIEAPRRKKLLSDNRCDDIWALRKKGILLPILYVVIDEYITVKGNLESQDKDAVNDFDNKMRILISQLPSQGIRLIFVPHRATGIVDKTNRSMISYAAVVKGKTDDIKDTLDIRNWDRALTKPGDIAVKSSAMKSATYVKGSAVTADDADNTLLIEAIAKAFYKMGADMPNTSEMRMAVNRNEDYIRNQLYGDTSRVQYSAENILKDL